MCSITCAYKYVASFFLSLINTKINFYIINIVVNILKDLSIRLGEEKMKYKTSETVFFFSIDFSLQNFNRA